MKKSELIEKLIEIEKGDNSKSTITMSYTTYLEILKKAIKIGDIEI